MTLNTNSTTLADPQVPSRRGASLRDAKSRVPQNVVFNFAGYFVVLSIAFLITPFLVHRLGTTAYGIWGLVGEILGYSFLLDFGLRIAVTRYVGRYLALHEPDQVNTVLTTSLVFSAASALLALSCGGIATYFLPHFFAIPNSLIHEARWCTMIVSAGLALTFPGSLFTGSVAALSRYDLLSIRNIVPAIFRALLLWFFLTRGYGLVATAVITACGIALSYVLDAYFVVRYLPEFRIQWKYFDRSTLRTLIGFSVYAFLLSISARLLFMTDNVVVGYFLGPAAVTFYSVGMTLPDQLRSALGNITNLFAPLAAQMDALSETESLRNLFFRGPRITLVFAFAGFGAFLILGPSFLGIWMGQAFLVRSAPVLRVLATEVIFFAMMSTCGQVLYGMARHRMNAWLSLSQAFANLVLSIALIHWFGAVGVAWGTLIPAIVIEGVVTPAYTGRLLGVSLRSFYMRSIARPVIAAVPYIVWLWTWRSMHSLNSYISLAIACGSGLLVYCFSAWHVALDDYDRFLIRSWVGKLWLSASATKINLYTNAANAPIVSATRGERKIHILTVARFPVGGIRTYLKYVYGQFDPAKYRFTVAALRFPETLLIPDDLAGFEVDLRPTDEAKGTRGLFATTRAALREGADIIHSQGLTSAAVAVLANLRTGRPHIATHHDIFRREQFSGLAGRLKLMVLAQVLRRCDKIVCVTEDARRNFFEFLPSFPCEKVTAIVNGIDPRPFAAVAAQRQRGLKDREQPRFVFLGRFMPQKGFDILIEAIAEIEKMSPSPDFVVVAVNHWDCVWRYKAEIKQRGLERRFEFRNFTASVADVLADVDAVVQPSRWEAGPLMPMEVLSAGCPLIASDCVGMREIVAGTPAMVVRTGDAHSLAEKMLEFLQKKDDLRSTFLEFAATAQDRFDCRRTARATEDLLLQASGFDRGLTSAPLRSSSTVVSDSSLSLSSQEQNINV